jgi:transposase
MKHAPEPPSSTTVPIRLPATPPGGLTAGLDWAKDDHVVAVVDYLSGAVRDRFTVGHTAAGLSAAVRRLAGLGCAEVAIERPDGPVVAELLGAGLTLVVISPNQVKHLPATARRGTRTTGNKDDRFDAYVLADTLRTDRARLRPLVPDSPATVALRGTCRARKDLVGYRVALANQLRAHLQTAMPGVVGLFRDLDSAISLKFLTRFDTQDKLDWCLAGVAPSTRQSGKSRSVVFKQDLPMDR